MPIMRKSTGDCAASSRSIATPMKPRSRTVRPSTLIASPAKMAKLSGTASARAADLSQPPDAGAAALGTPLEPPAGEYATRIIVGITTSRYPLLARSISAPIAIPVGANSFTNTNAERPGAKDEPMKASVLRAARAERSVPGRMNRAAVTLPTSCMAMCTALISGNSRLSIDTFTPTRPLKMTAGRSALRMSARRPACAFLSCNLGRMM